MKKGFTVVELLGVILIMGLIAVIAVPAVTRITNSSKEKAYDTQIKILIDAAKKYMAENPSELPNKGDNFLTVQLLLNKNYISNDEVINPKTNEPFDKCIRVTYKSKYSSYDYKYTECDAITCELAEGESVTFDYNGTNGVDGSVQEWEVPCDGQYKLEVWGAQGGGTSGGKGGYSIGKLNFVDETKLYIYVGGKGQNHYDVEESGGGGGATDIRITGGNWYDGISLNNRIIVAGGGGGSGNTYGEYSGIKGFGGNGGGTTGQNGTSSNGEQGEQYGYGGTQVAGGKYNLGDEGDQKALGAMQGGFGYGGNARYFGRGTQTEAVLHENMTYYQYAATYGGGWNGGGSYDNRGNESGGAGGGWYGGGAAGSGDHGGGAGGGSGWVFTISTFATWQSGNPTDAANWKLNSMYYLNADSKTFSYGQTGYVANPKTTGHGYARITYLGN